MIRAVGVDQRAPSIARPAGAYAVIEVDIRYLRPGRLGDDLLVVSRSTGPRRFLCSFINKSCEGKNNSPMRA